MVLEGGLDTLRRHMSPRPIRLPPCGLPARQRRAISHTDALAAEHGDEHAVRRAPMSDVMSLRCRPRRAVDQESVHLFLV